MRTGRINRSLILLSTALVSASFGATATFTPVGPTTVAPGTPVQFNVTIAAQTLLGFNTADIVIGTNHARDLSFTYSAAWQSAFANRTPPTLDPPGFYAQDVFVGGNNPASVGRSLALGVVTLDTTGLLEGSFQVRIDADLLPDRVSAVSLNDVREDVSGLGVFTIVCPPADPECDNDVDLGDFRLLYPCLTDPDVPASSQCQRFDTDADADVDFRDLAELLAPFTGPG